MSKKYEKTKTKAKTLDDFDMTIKMIRTALDLLHPAHYSTLHYVIEHLER